MGCLAHGNTTKHDREKNYCSCEFHFKMDNFCINEVDLVDEALCEDSNYIECDEAGFVQMVANHEILDVFDANVETPDRLIGGGEHLDDVPHASCCDRSVNYEATCGENTYSPPLANKRY